MAPGSSISSLDGFLHGNSLSAGMDGTTVPGLNLDNAVAVIGIACKFAGADSVEQLWDILENGRSQYRDLPDDRFPDWRFDHRASPKNFKANTIDDVDAFDHKFFRVPSREATFMDPQQRLALQIVYQALESSEYFSRPASDRELDIGCYLATCTNEYHENVACHPPTAFSLTGSIRPFIAGKVSHHFGWTGPAIVFDTACAASGTAIHQACRAVATGECSAAVAGATNIFVSPDTFQDLAAGHFISSTGASKAFDVTADGYCRGEGVAFVVLKKLSLAIRDGDPVRGVIASTAVGQNANKTSITVPHGPSQMHLYRKALQLAGLTPRDVSYVEAHGTGTPVGDPIEVSSIRGVFGQCSDPDSCEKTYLGSIKSNIGHTEASSGISGLIKVLLMMQKGVIPKQALFNSLNPAIPPLEADGLEIPTNNVPWTSRYKAACVNNYGASGTNAVMIVTQPPDMVTSVEKAPITAYPVSITAFTPSSLASYSSAMLEFIESFTDEKQAVDVSYHLCRRKNLDLPYTASATVSSRDELRNFLKSAVHEQPRKSERTPQPVVLFFSGQPGGTVSVPRAFYESSAIFRKHLIDCDTILQTLNAPCIIPAIFEWRRNKSTVLLHSMLFSAQYASAMAWLDCGLKPARLVGHSFGQITALCISGVLSLEDSLRLVVHRAHLIENVWERDHGLMIAIEADPSHLQELLQHRSDLDLSIACYNGPRSFVVGGRTSSIHALEHILKDSPEFFRSKRLSVANAFHSILAEPLVKPLREMAECLEYHDAEIPLEICSEDGIWEPILPDLISLHIRKPVYFHQAVERISERLGPCTWLEAGTGAGAPVLRRALENQSPSHTIKSMSLDATSPLKLLAEMTKDLWESGLGVHFWPFHQSQRHCYEALNIPLYQFDKQRHWLEWKPSPASTVVVQDQGSTRILPLQILRKTEVGGEFEVNPACEFWQAKCSENRVLGVPVCPVSVVLSLVSHAIDMIAHDGAEKVCISDIRDLAISRPIPAEPDVGLRLEVASTRYPQQSWTFKVSSTLGPNYTYISGTVSVGGNSLDGDFARFQRLVNVAQIGKISNDNEADLIRGKAVYKSVGDLFQFPESVQRIREISSKGREAAGYLLSLPNDPFIALESFIQVPLLCLNGLRQQKNEVCTVNQVGHAKFRDPQTFSSGQTGSWAVYVDFFESDGLDTVCDVFVFDLQSKQLFSFVLDVHFAHMQRDQFRGVIGITTTTPPPITTCDRQSSASSERIELATPQESDTEPELSACFAVQAAGLPNLTQTVFDLLARIADLDPETLRSDLLVSDLGIDSLMAIDVTEEINKFFSIEIDLAEAATAADLGTLCELIASKMGTHSNKFALGSKAPTGTTGTAESSVVAPASFTSGDIDLGDIDETTGSSLLGLPSAVGLSSAVLQAFDYMRGQFDELAKESGCDKFWAQVYPRQADLIVSYVLEAFVELGCDLSRVEAGARVPKIEFSARKAQVMAELMHILSGNGLITRTDNGWIRTSKPVHFKSSSSDKFERIISEFPQFALEHRLLHVVGPELAGCLSGKLDPMALLFGTPEKRKLMADQYLLSPIQSAVSRQLVSFIQQCFNSQTVRQTFRVLEIGGGTCGTSLPVVEAFAQLGVPIEYTFSDISQSFVSAAKSKLAKYKFVKYRILDVTKDPDPSLEGRFDMIIATNVIHATPDVCASTRNARQMLRSGGFLTLVEYTRRLCWLDIVFGQLDGWWMFEDDRDHATMDEHAWKATLRRAGFANVDWTRGRSQESEILRIFLAF